MSETEHAYNRHYDRLAENYERFWVGREKYVTWMTARIAHWIDPAAGARMIDIGGGTGLFLRKLIDFASPSTPILCADPSQGMLDAIPPDPRIRPVLGAAEQIASGEVALPYEQVDAIVLKEVIHHVADIPNTLKGLAQLLAPGGRILVVSLPPVLEYPLFTAALERFAAGQPEPDDIADAMRQAGLEVTSSIEEFPVSISRAHWLSLVAGRAMSVLSTFTDSELDAGLAEIRARHPEPTLNWTDRFGFIMGTAPSA